MASQDHPITPNTPKGMQNATGVPLYELQDPRQADAAYASYVRDQLTLAIKATPTKAKQAYTERDEKLANAEQEYVNNKAKLAETIAGTPDLIEKDKSQYIEAERRKLPDTMSGVLFNPKAVFKPKTFTDYLGLAGAAIVFDPIILVHNAIKKDSIKTDANRMARERTVEAQKWGVQKESELSEQYDLARQNIQSQITVVREELTSARQTERLFGMSEALVTCAEQTGASILQVQKDGGELLERLCSGQHTLADLNAYIEQTTKGTIDALVNPEAFEGRTPEMLAQQAFVSHVIIPHLDYFIMQGLENTKDPEAHDLKHYDALKKIVTRAGMRVDLTAGVRDTAPDTLIKDAKGEAIPTVDLTFIRDSKAGTVQEKLQRASQLVDGEIDKHTEQYKKLEGLITDYLLQVQSKQDEQRRTEDEKANAATHNARFDDEMARERLKGSATNKEYRTQQIARFVTSCASIAIGVVAMEPVTLTAGVSGIASGVTNLDPASLKDGIAAIVKGTGGGNIAGGVSGFGRVIGDVFAGSDNQQGRQQFIDILAGKKIDVSKLDDKLKAIQEEVTRLQQEHKDGTMQASATKAEAITGLFVMKSLLDHGQFVTEGLEERWKNDPQNDGVPFAEFFKDLGKGSRVKEAVEHLCFGYADSNDLAVILAASNTMQGDLTASQRILHEFIEEEVKPNIASYCQHASQVDFIYQSNLTGIGTPFHKHRKSIRDEHDRATEVMIQDAFGVTTDMVASNIIGAQDIRNVFGLYLTRHGSASHITDEGIQDGMYGKIRQKKSVRPVPSDTMDEYVEMAKAAGGIRAKAPDISNVFTRVCGYEYYYPLAPNSEGVRNIMEQNADAPATYMMVNNVIHGFIKKLSFASVDHYQGEVKEGSPVDNLLAQSFMDFFQELGKKHAEDPEMTQRRADFASDRKASVAYSARLDRHAKFLTDQAMGKFDMFKDIYKRNLSKVLEVSTLGKRAILEQQLEALEAINPVLNPKDVIRPDTHEARLRAETGNHTFANMSAVAGVR